MRLNSVACDLKHLRFYSSHTYLIFYQSKLACCRSVGCVEWFNPALIQHIKILLYAIQLSVCAVRTAIWQRMLTVHHAVWYTVKMCKSSYKCVVGAYNYCHQIMMWESPTSKLFFSLGQCDAGRWSKTSLIFTECKICLHFVHHILPLRLLMFPWTITNTL